MICDKNNEILNSINKLVVKYSISVFDENSLKGCIRHILIRTTSLNEYMVVLVTGSKNINNKHTSMILGVKNITLFGKGYVVDELCGLKFRTSQSSF